MDSSNTSSRLRQVLKWLAMAATSLPLAFSATAHADLLIDQRNAMIAKFINEMHADPLVADCAAHGNFVASTSSVIDHVEFPPEAFDSDHAKIAPWNESFDEGKQRVKVENVVTVNGQGVARESGHAPYDLTFRCGYVGTQMLAFSWNDPEPAAKPHTERAAKKKGKGKHGRSAVKRSGSSGKKKGAASSRQKKAAA
ncbi:BspC domain-containing protein [Trinickia fusca]|uniref:Nuclear transport factor 2 family protein n=1 Tax=Trinickia fusca TaxID=2419777 RepID=A0A494X030_9BURK|nr:hypothetical protein D7S89_24800 [Trinickia fusca]